MSAWRRTAREARVRERRGCEGGVGAREARVRGGAREREEDAVARERRGEEGADAMVCERGCACWLVRRKASGVDVRACRVVGVGEGDGGAGYGLAEDAGAEARLRWSLLGCLQRVMWVGRNE